MSAVLAKGRFLLDSQPVINPSFVQGYIHRWTVTDFDADTEYSGLAASLNAASMAALTKVKEARRG